MNDPLSLRERRRRARAASAALGSGSGKHSDTAPHPKTGTALDIDSALDSATEAAIEAATAADMDRALDEADFLDTQPGAAGPRRGGRPAWSAARADAARTGGTDKRGGLPADPPDLDEIADLASHRGTGPDAAAHADAPAWGAAMASRGPGDARDDGNIRDTRDTRDARDPSLVSRAFFAVAAAANVGAALLVASVPMALDGPRRLETVLLLLAMALLSLACWKVPRRARTGAMTALLVAEVAVIAWTGLRLGWGLAAPGFATYGLLVCVLCASAGVRAGATLTAAAAAALLVGLNFDLGTGFGGAGTDARPDALLRLGTLLLLLAAGLACGALTWRMLQRAMGAAGEREQRFRRLLALAADAYWEIDAQYRLVTANWRQDEARGLASTEGLGTVPWELPRFSADAETLDLLQADLDTRAPFHDLAVRWVGATGRTHLLRVSGEPRFNARGRFIGYWGVARDVTADVAAREALQATETRYQELFTRSPTPLLVHRNGRVLDANPAAVQLFGHTELQTLLGTDILLAYESGDSRERARRRIEQLHAQIPGTALPVAEFQLQVGTRRQSVRATGVCIIDHGTPAILSIFIDVTERRAAEEAARRSEALLRHLVATSPDLITLTDMETGRYAMVNHAFEQSMGWSSDETVGRSSLDLGVWAESADRELFVTRLRESGTVLNMPTRFRNRQGRSVKMLVSAARFVMDRRDYVVINARDVTDSERSRLEREAILENASIGIAVTRDRQFVLANAAFEQIFGWLPGALLGQPGRVVWTSDEDYADVGRLAGPVLSSGQLYETERLGQRRDGSTFLARVRGRAVDPQRPASSGTVWIIEDITERRDFEQTLARARDAAEAANRAKSAFLANTSHELRTPLNGMIGLAQLARAPDTDETRRQEYLDQIAESAQSLAGIISDILDLSKIEAGKLLIESAPFDLGAFLASLRRAHAASAQGRGLTLVFDVAPEVAQTVAGDSLRVRQILANYLSNALKFTASGEVRLTARRLGERVRFVVQDTGPGIAAETQLRLFRPFTQADESTTRRFGGTGLGLSICRELALLLQGEVGVTSQPGQGSSFWVELPLPPATAPVVAPTVPGSLRLGGARVLLVEDNAVNMMIAQAMLERWGVVVTPALDGAQALRAVQQAADAGGPGFDAVLMDVQMPVMSGHQATRALRAAGHHLPVIALTAAALVSERQEAMAAGMNDFLTKPIDAEKLLQTLARWVTVAVPDAGASTEGDPPGAA